MNFHALSRLVLILAVATVGMIAGNELGQQQAQSAQASSMEQNMSAVQAALGVLDMLKSDMQRAGFAERNFPEPDVTVALTRNAPLELVEAGRDCLVFRSPDAQENISYRIEGQRLVRTASGQTKVLLQKVGYFNIQRVLDGTAVNLAFSLESGVELHFAERFQRAREL